MSEKKVEKKVEDNAISGFQKAAKADGLKVEVTGAIDKATKEAMKSPGENVAKWAKEEIGDIREFQKSRHMLITGEADYFTLSRYLQ